MAQTDDIFAKAVHLHRSGDLAGAEALYRQLLELDPGHLAAVSNLGVTLAQQGRPEEAIRCYQSVIQFAPNYADARFNLGNAYRGMAKYREAAEAYQAVLELNAGHVGAWFNLGLTWWAVGQWEEARKCFAETVRLSPDVAEARNHLGYCLHRLGQLSEAVDTYRELLRRNPQFVKGYHNLGLALTAGGHHEEAVAQFKEALRLQPEYAEAHNSLGVTLESLGRPEEALQCYERAVQLKPQFADALNNLGVSYTELGRHHEAIECRRMALGLEPDKAHVHSNMLLSMNYSADITPGALFEEHREWARLHANLFTATWHARTIDWNPNRELKIGYVSGDFRTHTVASFLLPLLGHHNHNEFHITAFSNVRRPDEMSERMKSMVDEWISISEMSDRQVVALIREKRIDLLVDLSGHTAGNRLIIFAHKPAPVQVTMFGYPNTTGMDAMDYRVSDYHSDPLGQTERFHTEQLIRLSDAAWVYEPLTNAEPESTPPFVENGYITFGSLNNPAKLTSSLIRTWASLVLAVPQSRLIVLAGREGFGADDLRERFEQAGLPPDQLEVVPRQPLEAYFSLYNRIDIHLDTFPYNGGVTTCDALWMAAPTITLAGETYVSRQGLMLLNNLGLDDLIAHTTEEYVEIAQRLARDEPRLRELRGTLRQRLAASAIMKPEEYVPRLEEAFRHVWRSQTLPH